MSTRPRLASYVVLLVAMLFAVSGCTTETREGDTTVFTFAAWIPVLVFFAGVLAFGAGIALRVRSSRGGWVFLILGPLIGIVIVPGLFLENATVDDDHFTLRTGFWFAPTVHDVAFSDLSRIEMISEERRTRRGTSTSYYLVCHRKQGGVERVPVGDLMKQGAASMILQTAKEQGIAVVAKT